MSAFSRAGDSRVMRPHENNECTELNAADVIGPVDSGERIIAKKGDRRDVNGSDWMYVDAKLTRYQTH